MEAPSYCLKEIANNVENTLQNIQEANSDIDKKINEVKHTKYLCLEKIFFEKNEIFQKIVSKYKTKEKILEIINYIFSNNITTSVCDQPVDFNNINYNIFDEDLDNLENEIIYINGIKKLKLKELEVTKKYLQNLFVYKEYKLCRPDLVFDNYFIRNKNSIIRNIKNKRFVSQYINYKIYKHKFERCLVKDCMKYQEYKIEEENIQKSLIELELELIEKQEKLERVKSSKKELYSIKEEEQFVSLLKKFFVLNFDYEHFLKLNEKEENIKSNFSFYYFQNKFISNLFFNIDFEVESLKSLYDKKWLFYKQIRCFQYCRKESSFKYSFKQTKSEIKSHVKEIKEKIKFIELFTNLCLDENQHINIFQIEEFFSYISKKYNNLNISHYKKIFVNQKTKQVLDNIFIINCYFINEISL